MPTFCAIREMAPTPASFSASLDASTPLFGGSSDFRLFAATPSWTIVSAVISCAQNRCHEVDAAAAGRSAELLARLTVRPDGRSMMQLAFEHVLDGLGRSPLSTRGGASAADGTRAMQVALTTLLERAIASGGVVQAAVAAAATAHAVRAGAGYESVVPSLLSSGARTLSELHLIVGAERHGLLDGLLGVLSTQGDAKVRLRAIECCSRLWECARERWPTAFEPPTAQQIGAAEHAPATCSHEAKLLATKLVNTAVDTAVYDPIAKLRLAATRLALGLTPALDASQVLKVRASALNCSPPSLNAPLTFPLTFPVTPIPVSLTRDQLALLKTRDKDKATRAAALKMCAALGSSGGEGGGGEGGGGEGGGGEDGGGEGGGGEGGNRFGGGIGARLDATQVHQIVLHGSGADASAEQHSFAADTFWSFLVARQSSLPTALAELRVTSQLELYEPLLRMHIGEAFDGARVCSPASESH